MDELRTFLTDRAGELLRVLMTYDGAGFEVHHRRADLDRDRIEARAREVHRNLTTAGSDSGSPLDAELGALHASLQVRSEVVIVHLPLAGERGVVVSLEPDAGSDLTSFLRACLRRL